MAQKKHWLECNSLKYQNKTKSNDFDISWSSSSSDSEDTLFYKYRKKIRRNNHLNYGNDFEVKCEITPPKSDKCSQNLSPIIGQSQLEVSPILNKIRCDCGGESPVIGNNLKIRLWKEHKENKKLFHSESFSDKFELLNTNSDNIHCNISVYSSSSESQREQHAQLLSQFSQKIDDSIDFKTQLEKRNVDVDLIESVSENSNDIFSQPSDQINIDCSSPPKSQDEYSPTISEFSTSQESRNCFTSQRLSQSNHDSTTHFSSGSSQKSYNEPVMYYLKVPRKKKYKKGGLMNQLQKALKNKSCNISMWQHELYLGKTDFCPDFLHLRVLKIHVEFNSRICMCCLITPETHEDNHQKCVLMLDSSVHHGVQYLQELKVYKPYSISNINYCNENICCYYNVFKILFES